ncbi:DUF421 domain-containing protein [Paenibacillus sp. 32352]|nr:YetF domain-containing protein [Paenibacillus sp. 32352]
MKFNFIWEAMTVLLVCFCLQRALGKKTVSEMTGLEIITLLSMASMIGHAVDGQGLWQTVVTLCIFVSLLLTVQFLAVQFDWVEKWFMGKSTLVIQDGQIVATNLKKLRLSVDQLEARLREKGISSISDIKTATMEISGQIGYEWMKHAKPLTVGEFEKFVLSLQPMQQPQQNTQQETLFDEVVHHRHQKPIQPELE